MSAADYYQGGNAPANPQYQNGANEQYNEQDKYTQQPPEYGYGPQVPQGGWTEKPTFNQAFKIDKPKYNDLWATVLVRVPHLPITASMLEYPVSRMIGFADDVFANSSSPSLAPLLPCQ